MMGPVLTRILHVGCLCCMLCTAHAWAEEGQYRSRIMLTPEGEWGSSDTLSIEELEQQLGSIEEAYARSSAGRHLARHYVQTGDYDKAVAFYREALAAEGLSAVANREMLRELAQVFFLKKDYSAAVAALDQALAVELLPDAQDYLLLARAHYHLGRYVQVVDALDRIDAAGLPLTLEQKNQALALYYQSGAFVQCESLLHSLLEEQPDKPAHWHMLTSVYLQQNKKKQALDQLFLAREKGVPFEERDILLLADLQAVNKNPYGAAQTLATALAQQEVTASAGHYRKLFEFWFQAREEGKAQQALAQAARLGRDTQLYLYLAQLQMEQQAWPDMYDTMTSACSGQLPDRFVGRANLLLGVSQLKLGDEEGARRSFINATLIGGVNAQAGQWLDFMDAQPATQDEVRRIVGICYGSKGKHVELDAPAGVAGLAAQRGGGKQAQLESVPVKVVPTMRLFYSESSQPLEQLLSGLRTQAVRLNVSLVKAGGSAEGPLHLFYSGLAPGRQPDWQVAVPTRGSVSPSGRFRVRSTEDFKCAWLAYEGPAGALHDAVAEFARDVGAAGHETTGEGRIVLHASSDDGPLKLELQVGIR